MFAVSIIIAIIIGFLFKGNLKNLINIKYRGITLVLIGFLLEVIMKILLAKEIIYIGNTTYIINIVMYTLIMVFILCNREDRFILTVGVGFLLNIIVIFANGCTMPVGQRATEILNFTGDLSKMGLYSMVNSKTSFVYLADIIPYKIGPLSGIASVGDLLICIGIIGIIIREMKKKSFTEYKRYEI